MRLAALDALADIAPCCDAQDRTTVLERLKAAAGRETDKVIKMRALKAIASFDANALPSSMPTIVKLAKDPDPRVRKEALTLLGGLGSGGPASAGIRAVASREAPHSPGHRRLPRQAPPPPSPTR